MLIAHSSSPATSSNRIKGSVARVMKPTNLRGVDVHGRRWPHPTSTPRAPRQAFTQSGDRLPSAVHPVTQLIATVLGPDSDAEDVPCDCHDGRPGGEPAVDQQYEVDEVREVLLCGPSRCAGSRRRCCLTISGFLPRTVAGRKAGASG